MRGSAILAVVFYHAHVQVSVSLDTSLGLITTIDAALRPFRMPVLMILSGLLLPVSLMKSGLRYVQGKTSKIAWPYVFWSSANLVVLAAASSVRSETVSIATFLKIFYAPPTYHWYLAYLFVFYLFALLLHRVAWLQNSSILIALVLASFVEGDLRKLLYLWAFFAAGDFVARYWTHLEPFLTKKTVALLCAVAAVPAVIMSAQGTDLRYDPVWAFSVCASIFALLPVSQFLSNTRFGALLVSVGKQSIVYYVVHYLVITITFHILLRLGMENPFALFFMTASVALIAGAVLVRWRRFSLVAWLFEWAPKRH